MGTISGKLTYLNDTRLKIKDSLNKFGADLTENDTFRSYSNVLNDIYDKLPKVSGNGSNFTLENVQNGKSDLLEIEGNTIHGRLPSEYTQVDYIESSGEQYIDTGVNADYKLSIDIKLTDVLNVQKHMGALRNNGDSTYIRHHFQTKNSGVEGNVVYYVDTGCYRVKTTSEMTKPHIYNINVYNNKIIYDNETLIPITRTDFDTQLNYWLFWRNRNDSLGSPDKGSFRIYYCKMYVQDVLVRDFIPCYRNSDNEVGLYDLVNDVFYTNQGIGVFTYGVIAPTPDSPIDIEVVENKQNINVSGKNLLPNNFTIQTSNGITFTKNSDGTITANGTSTNIATVNIPNGTLTIPAGQYKLTGCPENGGSDTYRIDIDNGAYPSQRDNGNGATFTLTEKTIFQNVRIRIASGVTVNNLVFKPMLRLASITDDTYEPYHNQDYEIDLHGKNLFDKNNTNIINGQPEPGSSDVIGSSPKNKTIYITCKPNTTYTIQKRNDGNANRFAVATTIERPVVGTRIMNKIYDNNASSITLTTDNTSNYLVCLVYRSEDETILTEQQILDSIQIEENSIATEYEEFYDYKLCKIGDYKDVIFKNNQLSEYYDSTLDEDSWYIKKEIGKVVLDGSEGIVRTGTNISGKYRFMIGIENANMIYVTDVNATNYILADKLIAGTRNLTYNNTQCICYGNNTTTYKNLVVYIEETSEMTIEQFKTWLGTNNVTVYYVLLSPTYEKITNSTLINQLEAIETETGTNIFEVSNENNVLPSLNVKRLKELEKLS